MTFLIPTSETHDTGRSLLMAIALSLLFTGCASAPPLPPLDLQAEGWQRWDGQALWQPAGDEDAVAGDLVAARGPQGDMFVTLIKSPVTLFTARIHDGTWHLETIRDEVHSGRGNPPRRFIWFQVPAVLAGKNPPRPWTLERRGSDEWRLVNPHTHETLRLFLD